MAGISLYKLPQCDCHWTSLMSSQHRIELWLGGVGQQAIIRVNIGPDLWRHMASQCVRRWIKQPLSLYHDCIIFVWKVCYFLVKYCPKTSFIYISLLCLKMISHARCIFTVFLIWKQQIFTYICCALWWNRFNFLFHGLDYFISTNLISIYHIIFYFSWFSFFSFCGLLFSI